MRGLLTAAVAALVLTACTSGVTPPLQLSEKDLIRIAVFRFQFENNASGLGSAAHGYYLRVEGGQDPDAQLVAQFDGHEPPVHPGSASELESGTAQVLDRETGLPGLIFYIEEIRRLSDDRAEVEGGYEEASESGSVCLYYLQRDGAHWHVTGSEMLVIK